MVLDYPHLLRNHITHELVGRKCLHQHGKSSISFLLAAAAIFLSIRPRRRVRAGCLEREWKLFEWKINSLWLIINLFFSLPHILIVFTYRLHVSWTDIIDCCWLWLDDAKVIAGSVEAFSIVFSVFVVLKLGLRVNLFICMIIAGIACVLINFARANYEWLTISLAMIGELLLLQTVLISALFAFRRREPKIDVYLSLSLSFHQSKSQSELAMRSYQRTQLNSIQVCLLLRLHLLSFTPNWTT